MTDELPAWPYQVIASAGAAHRGAAVEPGMPVLDGHQGCIMLHQVGLP
jgi:hypothetical protein